MRRRSLDTIKFLTLEETRRLFKAIGDDKRNRALFLLAYRHGLRASEIGLLRKDDLDLKSLRLVIHRLKGSHSGTHPLQPDEVKHDVDGTLHLVTWQPQAVVGIAVAELDAGKSTQE